MERVVQRIREALRKDAYDLTRHAWIEMTQDGLTIFDVEDVMRNGSIIRSQEDDPRGVRHTLLGQVADGREVGVVGRFTETDTFLVITVYAIGEQEES